MLRDVVGSSSTSKTRIGTTPAIAINFLTLGNNG
jgi:hypothetical protein